MDELSAANVLNVNFLAWRFGVVGAVVVAVGPAVRNAGSEVEDSCLLEFAAPPAVEDDVNSEAERKGDMRIDLERSAFTRLKSALRSRREISLKTEDEALKQTIPLYGCER